MRCPKCKAGMQLIAEIKNKSKTWKCIACGNELTIEDKLIKLRERLAGYLHNQWWMWSKEITMTEKISEERLVRWKLYWTKYKNLVEDAKDLDRDRADEIINILKEFNLL